MSLRINTVLSSRMLLFDGFDLADERYDRVYSVKYGGEIIGKVFTIRKTVGGSKIIKVVGDPTKTLAIFIAVYVFMRGELPDISTDVKMISWDHR